jgi:hypothetical protein
MPPSSLSGGIEESTFSITRIESRNAGNAKLETCQVQQKYGAKYGDGSNASVKTCYWSSDSAPDCGEFIRRRGPG